MTQRASWGSMRKQNGFTIAELLIVIVVIAILAVITIIAYNGINPKVENTSRRADINALMKQAELFKIDKGSYPRVVFSSSGPALDLLEMLRKTGLYEATRRPNGGSAQRTFIFCSSPDLAIFTIIARPREFDTPLPSGGTLADRSGTPLIYISNGTMGEASFAVDPSLQGNVANNLCKSIHPAFIQGVWPTRWSYDVSE